MIFYFRTQRMYTYTVLSFIWTWMILNMIQQSFFSSHIGPSIRKQKIYCAWIPTQKPNRGSLFSGDASRYFIHELKQHQLTLAEVPNSNYFPCIDTVEIVVAYCNSDLSWINYSVDEIPHSLKLRMTILSKCGNEKNILISLFNGNASNRFEKIDIIPLANVGGCDYVYIYYMNYILGIRNGERSLLQESSVLLFIKDTIRDRSHFHFPCHHGYRSFGRMIEIASKGEFACGIYPASDYSWYHETGEQNKFILRRYRRISALMEERGNNTGKAGKVDEWAFNVFSYQSLSEFHSRALNYLFPQKYTPVCYGGSFAIPAKKLVNFATGRIPSGYGRELLQRIENSMMRDSNSMVEEHFIERTWASLFSEPLMQDQILQLEEWTTGYNFEGLIELKKGYQF